MYRWVDEKGRVHVSDVVPEKYKKTAKRMDSRQFEVTDADRKAAANRAAADRARQDANSTTRAAAATAPAQPAASPKPAAETECEAAQRRYRESAECFSQFVNAKGTMGAEAFQKCEPLPEARPRCER